VAALTSVIELLVGLACLALAAAVRTRLPLAAVVLTAAGLAAAVHAVIRLV
jgi:hypothetical protein